MFEYQKLLGSTERRIIVETKKTRSIDNSIALPPGEHELLRWQRNKKDLGRFWDERKPPCGEYNCAGHVWASRRTAIYNDEEWKKIIVDDGYRPLVSGEEPKIGDLVLYGNEKNGFIHVGQVVELRKLQISSISDVNSQKGIPWILSKWDDASGEYLHNVNDIELFRRNFPDIKIEYMTDRPRPDCI